MSRIDLQNKSDTQQHEGRLRWEKHDKLWTVTGILFQASHEIEDNLNYRGANKLINFIIYVVIKLHLE
jgi:hypothetical protein